ncbi:MAG: GNAT family N-acetyltransferase [Methylophilaceae bacterium]|nr:GNAT family N-acetyltransferase [Methylophilaceae bacterium]
MMFKIRTATSTDIPAMSALLDGLFSIEQDFQPNGEKQMKALKMLLLQPDRACLLVACDHDGDVIGMVSAQLVISTAEGGPSAWIEDMVVRKEYRGQGIGRKLLEQALAWASKKGATRAQLLVDLDNEPALGYYRHLGWQETRLAARRIRLPGHDNSPE